MRVLYWYCEHFAWSVSIKTIEDAPQAEDGLQENAVVAFIHVEEEDLDPASSAETKLIKNAKWVARKWGVRKIILHSFTHLGESKAEPASSRELLNRAEQRLRKADYDVTQTPWGYFLDLDMKAPGHPLARIFKEFSS